MRPGAAAAVAAALGGCLAGGGCTVGSGSGLVEGVIFDYGCIHAPGTDKAAPTAYKFKPSFFAGVPTEDLSVNGLHMNEITIRMQNNALALQYADTLYFDVVDSYEVARCVRGGRDDKTGEPLYNVTEPLPDGGSTIWCDWSANTFTDGGALDGGAISPGGPDAGTSLDGGMSVMASAPRIHLTPYTDVRSSFVPLSTCGFNKVSGVAVDGWIEFHDFGAAAQPDLPPQSRSPVNTDFVIQFGDRMRADFYVTLEDQVIISAKDQNLPPPREPQIGGYLNGNFDFNLERGRSAQPFP